MLSNSRVRDERPDARRRRFVAVLVDLAFVGIFLALLTLLPTFWPALIFLLIPIVGGLVWRIAEWVWYGI